PGSSSRHPFPHRVGQDGARCHSQRNVGDHALAGGDSRDPSVGGWFCAGSEGTAALPGRTRVDRARQVTSAPWLVALDVDGTVIHEDETLTDAVRDAVARARDAGHLVTLATGRSWETTQPILSALGLEPEFVVCANGAITMRRDPEAELGYRRE